VPSVLGLLEDRELAARQRVESLLEEMDRLRVCTVTGVSPDQGST
jgi:hypothetical protein